jgi:hypothetical protein
MTTSTRPTTTRQPNAWAFGASVFAGIVMVTVGVLQFIEGLVAVIDGDKFLVKTPNYLFTFNATTWGWIHLALGVLVAVGGFFIFSGSIVARSVGVVLASLSAIVNFLWLPYYPIWSIVIIAIDMLVIWGLTTINLRDVDA